jgi:hypothetical protein
VCCQAARADFRSSVAAIFKSSTTRFPRLGVGIMGVTIGVSFHRQKRRLNARAVLKAPSISLGLLTKNINSDPD